MNFLFKWFLYSAIFVLFLIVGYVLIFSLDVVVSVVVWLLFIILCFLIFCTGIFGLVMGHLNFIKLRNRFEVTVLMLLSILLGIGLSGVLFINAVLDYEMKDKNYTLEEKTRYLASMVAQVPSQKNMLHENKNGVTYYYAKEQEQFIGIIDTYIQKEKESFDIIFGDGQLEPIMIEIHNDSKVFEANFLLPEHAEGHYNFINKSIHVIANEDYLESLVLHEYTHYRIHQFSKKYNLQSDRLPIWFQEGTGEYFGNKKSFDINLDSLETVDFHLLDSNTSYHETMVGQFNPYEQSFLAVNSLVNNHGVEIIPELMMSETIDEFYLNLENITGKSLDEYQETLVSDFLDEQEEIRKQFALAYDAIEDMNYGEAEIILTAIKEIGNKNDIDDAEYLMVQIYLEQGLYEDVIDLVEVKIMKGNYGSKTNDLLTLTESYLVLGNIVKAFETIKEVEIDLNERKTIHRYKGEIDSALAAYAQINSNNPMPGYKKLIEEELITNEYIEKDLLKQLNAKYPNEF
ncbi:collagenase [Paenisporosarcina quisquiliarum]|uniref:collagenase n=1 Tax=Paenisporosarcina quisquiliarum TaxID=365346 RepID=UPI0037355082